MASEVSVMSQLSTIIPLSMVNNSPIIMDKKSNMVTGPVDTRDMVRGTSLTTAYVSPFISLFIHFFFNFFYEIKILEIHMMINYYRIDSSNNNNIGI